MAYHVVFAFVASLLSPVMAFGEPVKVCSNNATQVDLNSKPEGKLVFPIAIVEKCKAVIYSSENEETELTFFNMRRVEEGESCYVNRARHEYGNTIDVFTDDNVSMRLCGGVGKNETVLFKSTVITMVYQTRFGNFVEGLVASDRVRVNYKKFTIRNVTECRYVLKGHKGTFQSPGYPNDLLRGACDWIISSYHDGYFFLRFDSVINSQILDCKENSIEVYGDEDGETLLFRVCRPEQLHIPIGPVGFNSKFLVRVKSPSNGIGFSASYDTYPPCQVVVAEQALDFSSPSTLLCKTWNLTAPPGFLAALSFSFFDLPNRQNMSCRDNVVYVDDGEYQYEYCKSYLQLPTLIKSKGRNLIVIYKSYVPPSSLPKFQASFTSVSPDSITTNCFVQNQVLRFKCYNQHIIPCSWQCDGAMQCSDRSDESSCANFQGRWPKLQVFVVVMGSVCASTVIFCIAVVCFRRLILHDRASSREGYGRRWNVSDRAPLTPYADLPSPPPGYFNDAENPPSATVIHGTYFFGDEFSQSGIHSASLFGIPPPRYRSTESLNQSCSSSRSIWQRGLSSIPLMTSDASGDNELVSLPEESPPNYCVISGEKPVDHGTNNSSVDVESSQGAESLSSVSFNALS